MTDCNLCIAAKTCEVSSTATCTI